MGVIEVGKNIRSIRQKMGISQKELGAKIGKSESQVGAYENATTTIPLDIIFKVAEAAKIMPQDVISLSEKREEKHTWDAELRIYNQDDRMAVIGILAKNGYDVGQHKRAASPTGKAVNYYVHATDLKENADTSK